MRRGAAGSGVRAGKANRCGVYSANTSMDERVGECGDSDARALLAASALLKSSRAARLRAATSQPQRRRATEEEQKRRRRRAHDNCATEEGSGEQSTRDQTALDDVVLKCDRKKTSVGTQISDLDDA